jgi:hypothetical protein
MDPGCHLDQSCVFGIDAARQLLLPFVEKIVKTARGAMFIQQVPGLLQRKTKVFVDEQTIEDGQLGRGIVAIPGNGIDMRGTQQVDRVIVTKGFDGDSAHSREVADFHHART